MQRIYEALAELAMVNRELDKAFQHQQEVAAGRSPEPRALTADHKRLLRFKSFSYPFLCESVADQQPEEVEVDVDFVMSGDKMGWTNFLMAQETSIDADEIL